MTLILLAVLAAAATAFVLQPVFAGPEAAPRHETDRRVLRLQEKREQLLLTLAELDFEKDAGKIAPAEHAASRAAVLAQAAEVTARLDELTGELTAPPKAPKSKGKDKGKTKGKTKDKDKPNDKAEKK